MMDDGTELVALEELEELDGYSLVTYNLFFLNGIGRSLLHSFGRNLFHRH